MDTISIADLVREGAILDIQDGNHGEKHPTAADYVDSDGVPFLMARDFPNGSLDVSNVTLLRRDVASKLRVGFAKPGDVLLTHKGTIGATGIVPNGFDYVMLTPQVTYYRTDPRKLLNVYLRCAFRAPAFQQQLAAFSAQSTRPFVSISAQRSLVVPVAPYSTQRRIATLVSSYDDLIANGEQRIRVLEGMVRTIYREWFVLFRYFGRQKVQVVSSPTGPIPKTWTATTLGAVVEAETGKRPKGGASSVEDGVPSVGAENVNGLGRHDYAVEKYVPRAFFEQMRSGVVRDRDVALYKDGAYIGRSTYFRDGFPHQTFAVNEHVFLLRTVSRRLGPNMLYLWLQQPETVQTIRSKNANAAQPGINRTILNGLPITIPSEDVAVRFESLVEPFLAAIVTLAKQRELLRRARDILLVRLFSGRLRVGTA
ncbi:restriction endonuclease S subunits-like protein [Anaeromyxobacter diazotrophicus]|uniref:Restriction endonuclease S subunits-like protein n=2 Tax=Anaeromyxobacter diazotrophicus TaxID=2590199 RepID=A0A7I9VHS1_9BACT|nr:restriction endonuclease S subunits-like protein [Anaeromyxobacter diazotrophicus]